ncbi:nuclear factor 7, brain-like isoform X2 [Stegostoma tigrinum]|uniref:nuclear factor 7, brain-like isoform X2 n=1 Tax=Stegostoma tigrinum TaxID=3053191 RepID=UPI0028705607|nr:nuclear factor 7, brain-like isoform X2 [Stegostoma tigrinum]
MAYRRQPESWTEDVHCRICLDFFADPVSLEDSRGHKSHSFMPIKEAVEMYKEQLKSSLQSLNDKRALFLHTELKQIRQISEVKEQANCLQSHITSQFAKMHQVLAAKEQRLLRELRREEERILDAMGKNLGEIQENLNSIQEEITKMQEQMEQRDDVTFLRVETAQKTRSEGDFSKLALVSDHLPLGQFNGPLQYMAWREMLDTLHPAPASVILDVDTANPWLMVSEDRASVRLGNEERELPDVPQRFDRGAFILASEGFTSGRHYWQVEVADKTWWGLGVAAESAPRKGEFNPTPECGYWTVWLFPKHGCVARTALSLTPLSLSAGPRKVGVLLDHGAGQVSFYNADNMSHLHTYTHPFTERLYPFFCPGPNDDGSNSAPLSICSPRAL